MRPAEAWGSVGRRGWMTRNYALTFLAVTSRALVPLLLLGKVLIMGASVRTLGHDATAMIPSVRRSAGSSTSSSRK